MTPQDAQRAAGRPPTLVEVADAMGLDADELAVWLNERPGDVKAEIATTAAPERPSGFLAAPDPDATIRLDPAAEAAQWGVGLDEIAPAEDRACWDLHGLARLTFADDMEFADGRGLHYVLSTMSALPACVIKTVTPDQLRTFGESLIALANRATHRRQECTGAVDCPVNVHIHGCYADAGDCSEPDDHAHRLAPAAAAPAGPLRIEDFDGDAVVVEPNHASGHVANMVTDVWVDGVRELAGVALTRDAAAKLRDHLTALLGDAATVVCGESSSSWREDEVCLLPLGHEGWHKALAATWAPGIPAAHRQGDDTAEVSR